MLAASVSAAQISAITGIGPRRPTERNLISAGAEGVGEPPV